METYLEKVTTNHRSTATSEAHLRDHEAQNCDLWDDDDPLVALDEIISLFRRRGFRIGNSVMLPVHEKDNPTLTGEYVSYRNDEYGGSIFYHSTGSGLSEYLEYEEAKRSGLIYRLRFWDRRFELPPGEIGDLIDDRPPYRQKPVPAHSPITNDEYDEFVENTLQFIRVELANEHCDSVQSRIDQGIEVDSPGAGKIRSVRLRGGPHTISCGVDVPIADVVYRTYKRIQDVYGVYEGNTVVLLWESDAGNVDYVDGVVTEIGSRFIEVDASFGIRDPHAVDVTGVNDGTLRVVEKGIAEQRESAAFKKMTRRHESLLRGTDKIDFSSALELDFTPELELNTYQERAAVEALCTDDVFCIHGPPGTGKTRTLVTIIEHAVEVGDTILVCAHSNQAVDNIVAGESSDEDIDSDSLHRIVHRFNNDGDLRDVSLARISSSRRGIDPFVRQRYFLSTDDLQTGLGGTDIVASTTNTAAVFENSDEINFDLVVVDEATQASGPATAVPFGRGKRTEQTAEGLNRSYGLRTILAGDHKQLPPFVSDPEMRDQNRHVSLFELLLNVYSEEIAQTLYRQYRMHEHIAEFASKEFYNGRLEHGADNRTETIDGLSPLLGIDDPGEEKSGNNDTSVYNPTEAQYVVAQVQKSIKQGVSSSDIGVITGYSAQRNKIHSILREKFNDDVAKTIDVETIDKFQGGQREVIIVSFTRSNSRHNSGFLEHPPETGRKRLNVALTRAKKRLVLIGDWDTLATPADFREESESCADTFERLGEYLRQKDAMVSRS